MREGGKVREIVMKEKLEEMFGRDREECERMYTLTHARSSLRTKASSSLACTHRMHKTPEWRCCGGQGGPLVRIEFEEDLCHVLKKRAEGRRETNVGGNGGAERIRKGVTRYEKTSKNPIPGRMGIILGEIHAKDDSSERRITKFRK